MKFLLFWCIINPMTKQKQSAAERRKAFGERMQGFGGAVIRKADGTYVGLPEGMTPEEHEAIMLGWKEYSRTGEPKLLKRLGIMP